MGLFHMKIVLKKSVEFKGISLVIINIVDSTDLVDIIKLLNCYFWGIYLHS